MNKRRVYLSLIMIIVLTSFVSALTLQEQESLISDYNLKLRNYAEIAKTRALTSVELNDALNIAKLRKVQMLDILSKDSVLFGKLILDSIVIASLPENVKNEIEKSFVGEGFIAVKHVDDFESGKSSFVYALEINGMNFNLFFEPSILKAMKSSDYIKIKGYKLDSSVFVQSLEVILPEGAGGILPDTLGVQKVAVVLIGFTNAPFVFPLESKHGDILMLTQNDLSMILDKAKLFYKEASYEKVNLQFEILGPYTLDAEKQKVYCGGADDPEILTLTQIKERGFSRVIYIFNDKNLLCVPRGTIGKYDGLSQAWIPAGTGLRRNLRSQFSPFPIIHELGHSFGLWHANFLNCPQNSIAFNLKDCFSESYADMFDVMGGFDSANTALVPYFMHFNTPHKESLGYFSALNIKEIISSGTYALYPLEIPSSNIQVLKIPFIVNTGLFSVNIYYYIEYRAPIGFDNINEFHNDNKGVLLHISTYRSDGDTQLIDADLSSRTFAVNLGKTYVDPLGFFALTTIKADSNGAEIKIDLYKKLFIRGDANSDGQVDISDAVFILHWLFYGKEGPDCQDKADANDDGAIDISDPVYIILYLFKGEKPIPAPYPNAGFDTTLDELGC